jgi:hypothetical protein
MLQISDAANACLSITAKCVKAIAEIKLPDRTRIFFSALWFWTSILYYYTRALNAFLGFCLIHTPDSLIIFNPYFMLHNIKAPSKPSENPRPIILGAQMKAGRVHEIITNKLRNIINIKWDEDIGNDNCPFDNSEYNELFGGLNLKEIVDIYPTLSTAMVWIVYLFETNKKLSSISDEELGRKIKYMLINFSDKSICRGTADKSICRGTADKTNENKINKNNINKNNINNDNKDTNTEPLESQEPDQYYEKIIAGNISF